MMIVFHTPVKKRDFLWHGGVQPSTSVTEVLVLVVPDTDYNNSYPVLLGTNVIRVVKHTVASDAIPPEWKTAIDSITHSRQM